MGIAAKEEFYAIGPGQRPKPGMKPMPQWLGRLWCFAAGCIALYWSVPALRGRWQWREVWDNWWIGAFVLAVWLLRKLSASQAESADAEHEHESR
jgi:hypothetical protein